VRLNIGFWKSGATKTINPEALVSRDNCVYLRRYFALEKSFPIKRPAVAEEIRRDRSQELAFARRFFCN
jgi:hypothetical protein